MSLVRSWGRCRWGALLVVTVLSAAGCTGAGSTARSEPAVRVSPSASRMVEPVDIRVTGLDPDHAVKVRLSSIDAKGVKWSSSARFRPTDRGVLDLDHAKPLKGPYQQPSAMGLMETLGPAGRAEAGAYRWSPHGNRFTVTVSSPRGKELDRATFHRELAPRVTATQQTVPHEGFDGVYYRDSSGRSGKRPAILAFGGSEGGNSMALAGKTLAAAGYPTLTIAYFDAPDLPKHLVEIRLEYFATALQWLARQPGVDADRIYVLGVSRGSEAAQLLGVHYRQLVHGVIGLVPSNVVHKGLTGGPGTTGSWADTSAWSLHGNPLPYAQLPGSAHPTLTPASEIPVEQIDGPLFLACAGLDRLWPSCQFSHAAIERLEEHHDPDTHVLAEYRDAGHLLGWLVPYQPTGKEDGLGAGVGPWSNQMARAELWPRLMQFLHTTSR